MQSLTKKMLPCSVCAMSFHKGNWNWKQCLNWKCPGWTQNPQNVKGAGLSNSLFSFALQMDFFLDVKEVHCKWNEGVRWMLPLNHACFFLCLLSLLTHVSLFQRMCATSSAKPQFITTFPSTGTVSSSGYTSAMKETRTSATQSSPSFCRYMF